MLLEILLSVIVLWVAFLVLLRMFDIKAIPFRNKKMMLEVHACEPGVPASRKDCVYVAIAAVLIRLIAYLLASWICQWGLGMESMTVWNQGANWDGQHYIKLAQLGYDGYVEDGKHLFLVFFPLYPWLIRGLHLVIDNYTLCAYLISNVTYVIGCVYLFRLTAEEGSKKVAWLTVAFLSLFPYAFFFGFVRTESLFLMTTVMTVYYIRKHQFFRAGICGLLASLTRLQGVLLILVALAEIITYYKPWILIQEKKWAQLWKMVAGKVGCACCMGIGTLLYLLLNDVTTGNAFEFLIHQKEHWYQESQWFTKTIQMMLETVKADPQGTTSVWIFLPWLILFGLALVLFVYGCRRIPVTYMVWFGVFFVMNYMMSWPLSIGRYMSCTVPMFLVLARFCEKKPKLGAVLLAMSGILMLGLQVACLYGQPIY